MNFTEDFLFTKEFKNYLLKEKQKHYKKEKTETEEHKEKLEEVNKEIIAIVLYYTSILEDNEELQMQHFYINKAKEDVKEKIKDLERWEINKFNTFLTDIYKDYLNKMNMYLTEQDIQQNINFPWSGLTAKDRIKKNNYLHCCNIISIITLFLLRNIPYNQVSKNLDKQKEKYSKRYEALLITETAFAENTIELAFYKNHNIQKVKRCAELDDKTCNDCAELDGKIYPIEEAIYILPEHPHCRCFFLPYK